AVDRSEQGAGAGGVARRHVRHRTAGRDFGTEYHRGRKAIMNPFYKSKKFLYALATFLATLALAALPIVVSLDDETAAMLEEMLPLVFVMGALVIAGHTVTDVMAVWREGVPPKDLRRAAHELIDALPLAEQGQEDVELTGGALPSIRVGGDDAERDSS